MVFKYLGVKGEVVVLVAVVSTRSGVGNAGGGPAPPIFLGGGDSGVGEGVDGTKAFAAAESTVVVASIEVVGTVMCKLGLLPVVVEEDVVVAVAVVVMVGRAAAGVVVVVAVVSSRPARGLDDDRPAMRRFKKVDVFVAVAVVDDDDGGGGGGW